MRLPRPAHDVIEALAERGILGGVPLSRLCPDRTDRADVLLIATSECTELDDIAALAAALKEIVA